MYVIPVSLHQKCIKDSYKITNNSTLKQAKKQNLDNSQKNTEEAMASKHKEKCSISLFSRKLRIKITS